MLKKYFWGAGLVFLVIAIAILMFFHSAAW